MSNSKGHLQTMYERIPAVAALNKVPGFDPVKLLRRTVSPKTKEEVWRLDFPYKKLWFRLANPKGKIRLNALRVTEQLAIYEAQVFLDRDDPEPIGSFTACRTREDTPDGQYIQAAQKEAMNEALSDAGYGLQFADVSMDRSERYLGSEIPVSGQNSSTRSGTVQPASVQQPVVQRTTNPAKAEAAMLRNQTVEERKAEPGLSGQMRAHSNGMAATPSGKATEEELPVKAVETEELPIKASEPDTLPVSGESVQQELPVQMADTLPVELTKTAAEKQEPVQKNPISTEALNYTRDMPVETILERMTFAEALQVIVDVGTCKGWTIAQVIDKRPASLKFYVYGGYKGDNNILRAAAKLALDELAVKKAG